MHVISRKKLVEFWAKHPAASPRCESGFVECDERSGPRSPNCGPRFRRPIKSDA